MSVRVLHVGNVTSSNSNGVHRAIDTLARELARAGDPTGVIRFSRSASQISVDESRPYPLYTIPTLGPRGPVGSYAQVVPLRFRRPLAQIRDEWDVLHLHSVRQIDHLLIGYDTLPMVVTPHGGYGGDDDMSGARDYLRRLWTRGLDRRVLRGAGAVHALTAVEADRVRMVAPGVSSRVLPIPVDLQHSIAVGGSISGPVLFIGRLAVRQKGLDVLIRSWAQVPGALKQGRRLILAGPASEADRRDLAEIVTSCSAGDVDIRGPVQGEDKDALLATASWFIHSSRWEGLPLAMVEAAGRGLPLLATEGTGMGALIEHHQSGRTCRFDENEITQMLAAAMGEKPDAWWAASAGALSLAEGFAPDRLVPQFQAMYREAIECRGDSHGAAL